MGENVEERRNEEIRINFKMNSTVFSLLVNREMEIPELNERVAERLNGCHSSSFRLSFNGKILSEGSLASNNVERGSLLLLNRLPSLQFTFQCKERRELIHFVDERGISISDLRFEFGKWMGQLEVDSTLEIYKGDVLLPNGPKAITLDAFGIKSGDVIEGRIRRSEQKSKPLRRNFEEESISSDIEIVFSFDTAGTTAFCLSWARQNFRDILENLSKDIQRIKVGIIAHGDYCDGPRLVQKLDLTEDIDSLVHFMEGILPVTGSGEAEAYEWALKVSNGFSWSEGSIKAVVVIGDEVPHSSHYTNQNVDWREEADKLAVKGIKIYGVRIPNSIHSIYFYEELARRSGGIALDFRNMTSVTELFTSICLREACPQKFEKYAKFIRNSEGVQADVLSLLSTLEQPNIRLSRREDVIGNEDISTEFESFWTSKGDKLESTYYWDESSGFFRMTKEAEVAHSKGAVYRVGSSLESGWIPVDTVTSGPPDCKLVVMGGRCVGKSTLIWNHKYGMNPTQTINETMLPVIFWDNMGDKNRKILVEEAELEMDWTLPQDADAYLLCFAVDNHFSLQYLVNGLSPLIKQHSKSPSVPVYLMATQIEKRDDDELVASSLSNGGIVSREKGVAAAKLMKAKGYFESRDGKHLSAVLEKMSRQMDDSTTLTQDLEMLSTFTSHSLQSPSNSHHFFRINAVESPSNHFVTRRKKNKCNIM
eukprot:TRINITY_DN4002_c0_g1_i1.p1 TRINITY_DN4002_c0_g1~~TRINITY_DN4002_c0_g1_i1.p1  ORF type:complete len:708 (+),score=210.92 TRINITY_DN4002_c0_g1_i1:200-2323(+)